jgi:hypothetical protein
MQYNLLAVIVLVFGTAGICNAAGQSDYDNEIVRDVVGAGGGGAESADYVIRHTTGQSSAVGESSDDDYRNRAGFWVPEPSLRLLQWASLVSLAALRRRKKGRVDVNS